MEHTCKNCLHGYKDENSAIKPYEFKWVDYCYKKGLRILCDNADRVNKCLEFKSPFVDIEYFDSSRLSQYLDCINIENNKDERKSTNQIEKYVSRVFELDEALYFRYGVHNCLLPKINENVLTLDLLYLIRNNLNKTHCKGYLSKEDYVELIGELKDMFGTYFPNEISKGLIFF